MNIVKWALIPMVVVLVNCGGVEEDSPTREAWDARNHPSLMDVEFLSLEKNYEMKFDNLPLQGVLSRTPWVGSYWPTYKGGTSYRWASSDLNIERYAYEELQYENVRDYEEIKGLSPSEKFDVFTGNRKAFPILRNYRGEPWALTLKEIAYLDDRWPDWQQRAEWVNLTTYERARTGILKTVEGHPDYKEGFKIPTWEGLCHAWAAASLNLEEPKAVDLENEAGVTVSFGKADIRALISLFYHYSSADTAFLGGRCNQDFAKLYGKVLAGEMSKEAYETAKNGLACRDTNAGAFHVVLSNQISLRDEGFIADMTRDFEVWNHPVHGFESKVVERQPLTTPKQREELNAAQDTTEVLVIESVVRYMLERRPGGQEEGHVRYESKAYYRYRLELNVDGMIIGGEWLNEHRPDFLWKQGNPDFSGAFLPLKQIYQHGAN